jgi:hypothetical protein
MGPIEDQPDIVAMQLARIYHCRSRHKNRGERCGVGEEDAAEVD